MLILGAVLAPFMSIPTSSNSKMSTRSGKTVLASLDSSQLSLCRVAASSASPHSSGACLLSFCNERRPTLLAGSGEANVQRDCSSDWRGWRADNNVTLDWPPPSRLAPTTVALGSFHSSNLSWLLPKMSGPALLACLASHRGPLSGRASIRATQAAHSGSRHIPS